MPSQKSHTAEVPIFSGSNATSIGTPPFQAEPVGAVSIPGNSNAGKAAKATLTIERGEASGTEYPISKDEAVIGRWDADNGIFPDIDLDTVDQEAKVSRRHARILFREARFFLEDLGSTNGTYINRGRRLLPGTPQALSDGDEIIVGKTFLRFHILN
jgi:pSer/pThr/pTyr-binding forkhead associated (FHA) protein